MGPRTNTLEVWLEARGARTSDTKALALRHFDAVFSADEEYYVTREGLFETNTNRCVIAKRASWFWSNHGHRLVASLPGEDTSVLMDVDKGTKTKIGRLTYAAVWSPDDKYVLLEAGKYVRVLDCTTWRSRFLYHVPVMGMAWSPDSKHLAIATHGFQLLVITWQRRVWRTRRFQNFYGGGAVGWSPCGRWIAGSYLGMISLLDCKTKTCEPVEMWRGEEYLQRNIRWAGDDAFYVTKHDASVMRYDILAKTSRYLQASDFKDALPCVMMLVWLESKFARCCDGDHALAAQVLRWLTR